MAEHEISTRLQRVVEAAENSEAALFGKIHQHVHAKDAVEFADVHRLGQIHLRERDHPANAWLHLKSTLRIGEMGLDLAERDILEAALGIDAFLGVARERGD